MKSLFRGEYVEQIAKNTILIELYVVALLVMSGPRLYQHTSNNTTLMILTGALRKVVLSEMRICIIQKQWKSQETCVKY